MNAITEAKYFLMLNEANLEIEKLKKDNTELVQTSRRIEDNFIISLNKRDRLIEELRKELKESLKLLEVYRKHKNCYERKCLHKNCCCEICKAEEEYERTNR